MYLIYPSVIRELTRITHTGKIKRSNIAKLSLEIIKKEVENNNFQIMSDINNLHSTREVDLQLLEISLQKKYPLATIDKNLIKKALKNGSDIITLKNNKIIYLQSNYHF